MKMQMNPATRSTTASRRQAARWLHVSQFFKQETVKGEDGVEHVITMPGYVDMKGNARGQTYNIGRNKFKRVCRSLGLNRVQVQRKYEGQAHA